MTRIAACCCALALAVFTAVVAAAPEHAYRIRRSSVLPGAVSGGGDWILRGTIGQFDAGRHQGSGYLLRGGFWPRRGNDRIFRDGFDH